MDFLTHLSEEAIDEVYLKEIESFTTTNVDRKLIETFIEKSYCYLIMNQTELKNMSKYMRMLEVFEHKLEELLTALNDEEYTQWIWLYFTKSLEYQMKYTQSGLVTSMSYSNQIISKKVYFTTTENMRNFLRWHPQYLAYAPKVYQQDFSLILSILEEKFSNGNIQVEHLPKEVMSQKMLDELKKEHLSRCNDEFYVNLGFILACLFFTTAAATIITLTIVFNPAYVILFGPLLLLVGGYIEICESPYRTPYSKTNLFSKLKGLPDSVEVLNDWVEKKRPNIEMVELCGSANRKSNLFSKQEGKLDRDQDLQQSPISDI